MYKYIKVLSVPAECGIEVTSSFYTHTLLRAETPAVSLLPNHGRLKSYQAPSVRLHPLPAVPTPPTLLAPISIAVTHSPGADVALGPVSLFLAVSFPLFFLFFFRGKHFPGV